MKYDSKMLAALLARVIFAFNLLPALQANLAAEYNHSAFLDPDEAFRLFWTVKEVEKTLNFAVEVKTTGWVGFGISSGLSGSMKGADIVIGWVDNMGKGHISDHHATGNKRPLKDQSQDYELTAASENAGITILKFKRKIQTCDKNDRDMTLGTTKVIYAYGKTDEFKFHGYSARGAHSIDLINYVKNFPPQSNTTYFDILIKNASIPAVKRTYWCEAFKLSSLVKLNGTKHIVEIAPLVEKKERGLIHYIVLYACQDNFDETHLNAPGPCYHTNMPDSMRKCVGGKSVYAWAVRGLSFKFPDHVGWPIGAPYSMKYVVLEIHFYNPGRRADFVVTSGLRLYYDHPRKYEAETLVTGTSSGGALVIPPKQKEWILSGYCSKECSAKIAGPNALNGNEIKFFASFPHAHTAGTGLWTKHVRDGKEQPEVIRNENYDFHYQQTYNLEKELSFKAGDELITYCRYNTMKREDATIGGELVTEEACLNFIMYYPRVNLMKCLSHDILVQNDFSKRFARPVSKDQNMLYNSSQPPLPQQFRNWTAVKWNDTMVTLLANVYTYNGPRDSIYPVCQGTFEASYGMNSTKRAVITERMTPPASPCKKSPSAAHEHWTSISHIVYTLLFSLGFIQGF